VFLDQLVGLMRRGERSNPEIGKSAVLHGRDLLLQGVSVAQVVHDYGDVCQSITDLAVETDTAITTDDFRTLNRCLDDAIAGAVTEHRREPEMPPIDGDASTGELWILINRAVVAFDVLQTGNVGVGGSTGAVLHRSLMGALGLIADRLTRL
jgi:hypothetical protein